MSSMRSEKPSIQHLRLSSNGLGDLLGYGRECTNIHACSTSLVIEGISYPLSIDSDGRTLVSGLASGLFRITATLPPEDLEGDAMQTEEIAELTLTPMPMCRNAESTVQTTHLVLGVRNLEHARRLFCGSPPSAWRRF